MGAMNQLLLKKHRQVRERYKAAYLSWRDNRLEMIDNVSLIIESLELTRHQCNIGSLSGSVAGIVGGSLTGIGLITIPFTLGATTPLLVSGLALAGAGGATGFGSGMADMFKSKSMCSEAQQLMERDRELTLQLMLVGKDYAQCLQELQVAICHIRSSNPAVFSELKQYLVTGLCTLRNMGRTGTSIAQLASFARGLCLARLGQASLTTADFINHVNPLALIGVGKVANSVDEVIETGTQAGAVAVRSSKIGMVLAGVLVVAGLAFDLTSMMYTSRQIHVYRKNQEKETAGLTQATNKKEESMPRSKSCTAVLESTDSGALPKSKSFDDSFQSYQKQMNRSKLWPRYDLQMNDSVFWDKMFSLENAENALNEKAERQSLLGNSKSVSGSWEHLDISPELMLEIEDGISFNDNRMALEFEEDFMKDLSNMFDNQSEDEGKVIDDLKQILENDQRKRTIFSRIKHSFTREYVSERAEQLKKCVVRLHKEANLMNSMPLYQDFSKECACRQCASVGGAAGITCCHSKLLYWAGVCDVIAPTQNTASVCVTRHPMFHQLFVHAVLADVTLTPTKQSQRPLHRLQREAAYSRFRIACCGADVEHLHIPNCVRRVIVNAFQHGGEDLCDSKEGFCFERLFQ